jgi:hypothetical protein
MRFQPSSLGDVAETYGGVDEGYAAQLMLTTYHTGMDVGDAYGFLPGILPAIAGGTVGLVAPIVGAVHEGKQAKAGREHEIAMARQGRKDMEKQAELMLAQAELAAVEAETARAQSAGTVALASWIGGSVLLVGLAGIGLFAATRAKSRRSS